MIWGLQRRLLLLTIGLIGTVSVFFHYQGAGTAALQQDQRLLRLVPLLADSVVVTRMAHRGDLGLEEPLLGASDLLASPGLAMLLAPAVAEFLSERHGYAAFGVFNAQGSPLLGERWLPTVLQPPTTRSSSASWRLGSPTAWWPSASTPTRERSSSCWRMDRMRASSGSATC
jgi:two-component system sensor histidine kinase TctE